MGIKLAKFDLKEDLRAFKELTSPNTSVLVIIESFGGHPNQYKLHSLSGPPIEMKTAYDLVQEDAATFIRDHFNDRLKGKILGVHLLTA